MEFADNVYSTVIDKFKTMFEVSKLPSTSNVGLIKIAFQLDLYEKNPIQFLHKELNLYTDCTQRHNIRINRKYDIDKPLLNMAIQLKQFVETKEKIPTQRIDNSMRYEYAIQFISKYMNSLEKENISLNNELAERYSIDNDDDYSL